MLMALTVLIIIAARPPQSFRYRVPLSVPPPSIAAVNRPSKRYGHAPIAASSPLQFINVNRRRMPTAGASQIQRHSYSYLI
ncbi:hypothetical protein M5D96_000791 [Drosophila gunungcola]|uniref:Secreted protein n=1 Tax=Drosophila gunungcola TaxID=103775 RepID=A0A9P9YWU0_9MUSC|nr:hypothetical protein M5D96_000791 [Drosophila gunungcola]